MRTKLLKKVQINPLNHFEDLEKEVEEYEQIQDDFKLADFYHKLLSRNQHRPLVMSFIYAMIGFSTDKSVIDIINQAEELI